MITPEWVQMMARYNTWQNGSVRAALSDLSEADFALDRGAFFGSLKATLNHLLWGDHLWMSRFDGGSAPELSAAQHMTYTASAAEWSAVRTDMDARIQRWADRLEAAELGGDLSWYSGMKKAELTKPRTMCIAHFFNHQTHHRGQVHAMLTATGASPDDTDIILMPDFTE